MARKQLGPVPLSLRRLVAYAADVAFAFAALAAPQYLASRLWGFPSWEGLGRSPYLLEGWVLLTVSAPTWAYLTLGDASARQGTLGKQLLGLRVVGPEGERISRGRALARTAIKLLPWEITHAAILLPNPLLLPDSAPAPTQIAALAVANLAIAVYVVALVALGGTRALHDLPAGTRVVVRH